MTDRDLGALLDRASEHLPEVDFAHGAWAAAVAEQARRRRLAVGTLGAVAAAGLAVTAVQLGGSPTPKPIPAVSSTTPAPTGTLSDGTAYAVMPLEGKEAQLPDFDVGLPSRIDVGAKGEAFSAARPPTSIVAVYLRAHGERFNPVLVTGDGKQVVVDKLDLVWTQDEGGNQATPLGPRAIGGGGRYVVFPQRDHVVRLDTQTGASVSYAVPSQVVEWAGWNASGSAIVARDSAHAWTIDPWKPGAAAVPVAGGYEGKFRITASDTTPGLDVGVTAYDDLGIPGQPTAVRAPVGSVFAETISNDTLSATGAFFDQTITSAVIQRGNGPIYQGLLVVEPSSTAAKVLLAPENPDGQTGRFKGCCTVLGWADAATVLYQSVGSHGRWILAWNVTTSQVFEVSRLVTSAPDDPPSPIALNVGWRY
jgi:hypothetical protein